MPPPRRFPIDPAAYMSVGRPQTRASSAAQAAATPIVEPPSGLRRSARNIIVPQYNVPQPHSSDSGDDCPGSEDEDYDDLDDVPMSNESLTQRGHPGEESDAEAETRMALESALTNRLASAPDVRSKPEGRVRYDAHGGLQFWKAHGRRWIPAIYHYQIRQKLIQMAVTSDTDVYTHPRARGYHRLDVTSFLGSQKDWDLERDNGWTGVEILYMFSPIDVPTPTYDITMMYDEDRIVLDLKNHPVRVFRDLPSTLSSMVEGALMTVIRRLDPRIGWDDFWARLPKDCAKGRIHKRTALVERSRRWRNVNCVTSWTQRWGTKGITDFFLDRMSPAARAANSTRELKKLSKGELEEAKANNKGKHVGKPHLNDVRRSTARETQDPYFNTMHDLVDEHQPPVDPSLPASQNSYFNSIHDHVDEYQPPIDPSFPTSQNPYFNSMHDHVGEHQPPIDPSISAEYASPGWSLGTVNSYAPLDPHSEFPLDPLLQFNSANPESSAFASSSRNHEIMPTEAAFTGFNHIPPPVDPREGLPPGDQIDYRHVLPRTQEDINDIQEALYLTRENFRLRTGSNCPPTRATQSYSFQVEEIDHNFFNQWTFALRNFSPLPDLISCREPWRGGFKDWRSATGGDEQFMFRSLRQNTDWNDGVNHDSNFL